MEVRFIPASLVLEYEEVNSTNRDMFKKEYDLLSEYSKDDINEWLKLQKAKGELKDTDRVLLTLLVELHKKVDRLEALLENKEEEYIKLQHQSTIIGINFEYIQVDEEIFLEDHLYYARILLPIFPRKHIPLYLVGVKPDIAKIHLINEKNHDEWSSFVFQKEREYIRSLK